MARNLGRFAVPTQVVPVDGALTQALAERLAAAAQARLGRSLALWYVDPGSCNGCALELRMLAGVMYDLERFGLRFVASPRHADVMLVSGPVARNMHEALLRAHEAVADPKWVVALGDCAIDAGVFKDGYGVLGGVADAIPVDLTIRGCPPTPAQILDGLRALLEAHGRR
jgi:Ni,Fe-hydrogenase III small subunit